MLRTLRNLTGNARGCVYTEPLWGIPYNLFVPYASIYMLSLGLRDTQIGLIVSIGLVFQTATALLSGAITDKLGRKRTTLIFDLLAWSLPCLVWAVAQNFTYFLVAAVINSMWRITMNSWTCLLVEDTDPEQLVGIYSWIYISGMLAAFFAPLAGIFIQKYALIPTVRGLYFFAALVMTIKFVGMNGMVKETRQGLARVEATRDQKILSLLGEYRGVFRQLLRSPRTLITIAMMLVVSAGWMINTTFWSILVTEKLHIPAQHLALYTTARSVVMLIFFFLVMPRLAGVAFQRPMLAGFLLLCAGQVLLISAPPLNYLWLLGSTVLEGISLGMVNPFLDRLVAVTVNPQERARIMAIIYVMMIVVISPFGWIAGALSQINRVYPFLLNLLLFALGGVLVLTAARLHKPEPEEELAVAL